MDSDLLAMRSLGRKVKRSSATVDLSSYVSRRIVTVTKVNGSTVDVNLGSASTPLPLTGIRMTKSCSGIKAGDSVLLDTVGHISTVTAILA